MSVESDQQKFNSDELVPPSFITEKFIRDFLVTLENDPGLALNNYEVKPGSNAGDHYASVMFKIVATYETKGQTVKEKRFILKTKPEMSSQKKEVLDELPLFVSERLMYTETLPEMAKVLAKFGDKPWWPKLVYASVTPEVLVFEDLTQSCYEVHYELLSMDTIGDVLEKCAKFHAVSMVLAESNKAKLVMEYKNAFNMNNVGAIFDKMVKNAMGLGETIKTWPGFECIGEKITKLQNRLLENYLSCYNKLAVSSFNGLNHGDFHLRNLMFRKDEKGIPKEAIFLDFQIPVYQSLGFDLVYLLHTIGDRSVRQRKGEVIRRYHSMLVENLKLYGFAGTVPSLIDVHVEIQRISPMAAYQTLCYLPLYFIDMSKLELTEVFNDKEHNPITAALNYAYKNPEFVDEMKKLVTDLDHLGVFD